jgi:hypothetical protein
MFKVLQPISDAYVTNRVINGAEMSGSNVGLAGSLDLFKLYGYTSTLVGSSSIPNIELSRLLVQFDLNPLRELVALGQVDPGNASFSVTLNLYDVYGGQPTPDHFNVIVYPLSASFDEGHGRDVVFYSDFDVCNFQTSSLASGSWISPGANTGGTYPSACDYFTSSGSITFGVQQFFTKGTEDLSVDVTEIVSATLAGLLPDAGFRVSFTAMTEADTHSYFVKRFGSRQAFNPEKRPRMVVRFDDSIQDDTQNFYLDSPSYLFLYNYVRGSTLGNLVSGSNQVTGSNSLKLTLVGNFPQAALGEISSSVCFDTPTGQFQFEEPSTVLLGGVASYTYVTQSIVNAQSGAFAFLTVTGNPPGSNIAFTGFYSGTIHGTGFANDLLLVGRMTGTYVSPVPYGVDSGSFYYRQNAYPYSGWDITTPILTGSGIFTGTVQGFSVADTWVVSGTFAPAAVTSPQEFPYLFSGTFVMSSTVITVQTTSSVLVGDIIGTYTTEEQFVPSGSFYLPDGITPALSGVAIFTGSLDGTPGIYEVTGTFVPDGSYLFSASYITSQTLGPIPYVAGPFLASQLLLGTNPQTGIYSASVQLNANDPNLLSQWMFSGSVTFTPVWGSLDGTLPFLTGSAIKARPPLRGPQNQVGKHLNISVYNLQDEYNNDEQQVIRVNIWDFTSPYLLNTSRLPVELPGIVIRDVHYQISDNDDGHIVVPVDTVTNSTRLSNDAQTMFFTLDTANLTPGHNYVIDILVVTDNAKRLYRNASAVFRVVAGE